ncbi:MAG: SRPBCC domain-containing protein [Planctomycetes bacterium]|nr:SRPBCC domain-containing protein [Planctomycetota bacterium]
MKHPVNDRNLITTRVLRAAPAAAFDAWQQPEKLAEWWGPDGFTLTTHAMDFRAGGRWRFTMHGPDGRDYDNEIEYVAIEAPHHIHYRHVGAPDTEPVRFETHVTFAALGDRTLLTMEARFPSNEELTRVENEYGAAIGMLQTVARLAGLFE